MASSPITSWEIDRETMKTLTDFILLGSKITVDGVCNHEIKRLLLLGKKSYDKPRQCIKKQRYYFADKGLCSQSHGFSNSHVWIWELAHKECWALKNWCLLIGKGNVSPLQYSCLENPVDRGAWWAAVHGVAQSRTRLKQMCSGCWRRLLRVPWTARISNQSILKEISPEYSLKGCWSWSFNTLVTWCKEQTHWKRHWCWERLKAVEGDNRAWDGWMALLTQWTLVWVSSERWRRTGKPGVLQSMGS